MVAETFLSQVDLDSHVRHECVIMCQLFHSSVHQLSADYFDELQRKNYVTPTSYLELIQTFKQLLNSKREEILGIKFRYLNGLEKLDFAAGQVAIMQEELTDLQPILVSTSKQVEAAMAVIETETIEVEAQKALVLEDEAAANLKAAAAQATKEEVEEDLAEAMPVLFKALAALDTLTSKDITEIKAMKKPPMPVRICLEAVCVMKDIKPQRIPDPSGSGKMITDFWGPSVKMVSAMDFLDSLKSYDKDSIPAFIVKKIKDSYLTNPDFIPEKVKTVSNACYGLCCWVHAIISYDKVAKVVAPKKQALAIAEAEVAGLMAILDQKRAELAKVLAALKLLQDDLQVKLDKKKELSDNIDLCEQKLDRAEKLISGLGGEKSRWTETAAMMDIKYNNCVGDVLLGSGIVAYLGAFTVDYRNKIQHEWHSLCTEKKIPCSADFSLVKVLGDPVTIREWEIFGLPSDAFSTSNGIIVTTARRWPLMIDPQGQANKWIKNMEKMNNLKLCKPTDTTLGRTVENAIQMGIPVMLENVGEYVDPMLEPVLQKNIFKQGGVDCLRFGENVIEYNKNFRFYITTRLRNPHYMPEISVKISLLNFMITPKGLEEQLLGIVAAKEKPDLEEKKVLLIVESARNNKTLKEIEDQILKILSSGEGNILEDEAAVQVLSSSKVLSEEISAKQEIAVETEKMIDETREGYRPVAFHASVLFFVISDLANIEPVYQYSLIWFVNIFNTAIKNSEASDDLPTRIENLNQFFTVLIYNNVCRSLLEKDKLLFSFILTIAIFKARGVIEDAKWRFLLTGGVALGNPYPNPAPDWLIEKAWSEIVRASALHGMDKFKLSVESNPDSWKALYDSQTPDSDPFPADMNHLEGLDRLIMLRTIRPDKLVPAAQAYIVHMMGSTFVEPPTFDLLGSFNDSHCCAPLVFILSPGVDPTAALLKFGDDMGFSGSEMVQTVSLGQGQGPIAEALIRGGIVQGTWVVLQNCHLAASWMGTLEAITEDVILPQNTHPDFRLWLTTYPSKDFPVSILQNGVKMTNEPPKGLKANLLKTYKNDPISDPEFFDGCQKREEWHKLLFSLCTFHGVVQERRKFGPLGWNIPYEFNESDLRITMQQLMMFLNDYETIQFDALLYLTGECNYGGRVTDDKDRRLLNSILEIYYCPEVIHDDDYRFSQSGIFYAPPEGEYDTYIEYINGLPMNPKPEIYGLHENADITKDQGETSSLFNAILLTLPRETGGGGAGDTKSPAQANFELSQDILTRLPDNFNMESVQNEFPVIYEESMNTVLRQELIKFNRLITVIRATLKDLQKAIQGTIVMNDNLENIFVSMQNGRTPGAWLSKSYPSLKPLGGYVADLLARLKFFQDWIDDGRAPNVFWISGFYFTQSFLTGAMQNYARKLKEPIDTFWFEFEVLRFETDNGTRPEDGVFVGGLFIEGARWGRKEHVIVESRPKVLFEPLPLIWFRPAKMNAFKPYPYYDSPVYRTTARRGVLATTGHSTNFVLYLKLPSDKIPRHWINRGVALICALDD